MGYLKVTGFLRGTQLSVNGLIHLPGLGDFQMSQIDSALDPYNPDKKKKNTDSSAAMETEEIPAQILARSDPAKQESLDSENVPDPNDAEQTFPTEEEIEMAENESKVKRVKKVPKGFSDYQAAWIPDDEEEILEQSDEDSADSDAQNEDDEFMDAKSDAESEESFEERDMDTVTESDINDERYDDQIDFLEEKRELEKIKAAKTDKVFPDEVDTPLDQPAKVRFQKYRGLKSFRTTPWDPKENLPLDYAKIFQFQNFDRTKKRVMEQQNDLEDGIEPGQFITVYVKDVSELAWNNFKASGNPLMVFGLFPFEHKMTLINVVLKRTPNNDFAIQSKEKLIFQCGYRRFETCPIFSEHTNGNKHKFERFFQPNSTVVASFFGRIQFPPSPVLCFQEINGQLTLIATGSLLSCNPDRIILKRAVLSGHPFKIHPHSAIIRFMFFNRDDIVYFKPVELKTKLGRKGHIKQAKGTGGHFQAVFNGQLKSQDTVLLQLYKRVFPKWTYEDYTAPVTDEQM